MMDLLDYIPTWMAVLFAVGAIGAAYWFLGLKGMIAAIAAVVTLGAYRHGRKTALDAERNRRLQEELRARDVADQVDNDVGAMPPADARAELKKWGK